MDEEREEGGPTSKTTLSGEHGRQSEAKSPEQQQRADSPGSSCDSMKSDHSMDQPWNFKDGNHQPAKEKRRQQRADSPGPRCVSMKSDRSMNLPWNFKDGNHQPAKKRVQQQRADSPGPSCVSMKSGHSMDHPLTFKDGYHQPSKKRCNSIHTFPAWGRPDRKVESTGDDKESAARSRAPLDPLCLHEERRVLWVHLLSLKMDVLPERRDTREVKGGGPRAARAAATPPGRVGAEQLLVELRAGGVPRRQEAAVEAELRRLRSLDLLDFLAHLPLFILIHRSIVANPLDESSKL
ncbi:unnamed protein product [Boreogadus saida]